MNKLPIQQKGASAIVTIIFLAVLGYAVYVGIQYVPQAIESRSVDSILNTVETDQRANPVSTENDAKTKVIDVAYNEVLGPSINTNANIWVTLK